MKHQTEDNVQGGRNAFLKDVRFEKSGLKVGRASAHQAAAAYEAALPIDALCTDSRFVAAGSLLVSEASSANLLAERLLQTPSRTSSTQMSSPQMPLARKPFEEMPLAHTFSPQLFLLQTPSMDLVGANFSLEEKELKGVLIFAPSVQEFLNEPASLASSSSSASSSGETLRHKLEKDGVLCLSFEDARARRFKAPVNRVLLLDAAALNGSDWMSLHDFATPLLVVGEMDESDARFEDVFARIPTDCALLLSHVVRSAFQQGALQRQVARLEQERELQSAHLHQLNQAGDAFSNERDLDRLLHIILTHSRIITEADMSALYLVENDDQGQRHLRFRMAQNDALKFKRDKTLLMSHSSLAGYVALTGEVVCVDDVYNKPADAPYEFDTSFDVRNNYRTKSVVAVPLHTHGGEIFGVLQLVNRKRRAGVVLRPETIDQEVLPFGRDEVELAVSLAGQVAVAMENSNLHGSVEDLFEGFVTATARAIEQRDPATSGHSERVAILCQGLAEAVNESQSDAFRELFFTPVQLKELNYACLLHDFGKVIVHEDVLLKCNKLQSHELELLRMRFELVRALRERDLLKRKYEMLIKSECSEDINDAFDRFLEWDDVYTQELRDLDDALNAVVRANNPLSQWLDDDEFTIHRGRLSRLCHVFYWDRKRRALPLLSDHELRCLTVRHGSLSDSERREVERHVTHTFEFLNQIPWTIEYSMVPQIAHCHHERCDGSGYPLGLAREEIPVQSRIMAVCDIYDALTANDRPYKRSCTTEEALSILREEVEMGRIEGDLVELFIEREIWKLTTDWRKRKRLQ